MNLLSTIHTTKAVTITREFDKVCISANHLKVIEFFCVSYMEKNGLDNSISAYYVQILCQAYCPRGIQIDPTGSKTLTD